MPVRRSGKSTLAVEHRSRSPPASFTQVRTPKLKTWVLVRTSDPKRRRTGRKWSDATAALVSKVSFGLTPEDMRVSVILPNVLTLRCGFGGTGFTELTCLPLSDVRPYCGSDLPKLKQTLLKAVQEVSKARRAKHEESRQESACHQLQMEQVVGEVADLPATPSLQLPAMSALPLGTTQVALPTKGPECKPTHDVEVEQPSTPKALELVVCETLDAHAVSETAARPASHEVPRTAVTVSATTDEASPTRQPEFNSLEDVEVEHPSTPKARQLVRRWTPEAPPMPDKPMAATETPMSKLRLQQFTSALAMAFQDSGESVLTRKELGMVIAAKCVGLGKVAAGELDEALGLLDSANKVLCNNELVFLV